MTPMKKTLTLLLAFSFAFLFVLTANAQSDESIWITTDTTSYKAEEIVIVKLNAASSTSIQGFTFQIRYDAECLKPLRAASPISGMNGLQLPQTEGLVDASFASTTPQSAIGVLAEISFQTLGGCQTEVYLESASLAIRSESGFATPLEGIALLERNIPIKVDNEVGNAQAPIQVSGDGSTISLEPTATSQEGPNWAAALAVILLFSIITAVVVVIIVVYRRSHYTT